MAEYEMFKTTLMGGYDKEEVQEQIQRLKDEISENQETFKKQLQKKMHGSPNFRSALS